MYKVAAVLLLVLGVGLLIWGINASESFNSDVSRIFSGSPTDKAMWLMIGGAVAGVLGLFGLFFPIARSAR